MRRLIILILFAATAALPQTRNNVEWRNYSADNRSTKYSPLDQINKDNVSKLRVAWRHAQADPAMLATNPQLRLSNRYMSTPIMVGGVLYVTNALGLAEAMDPATGRTIWTQRPLVSGPEGLTAGTVTKGVAY